MPTNLPVATLGRTGLRVTRLGFGAMEIRGSRIWNGRDVTDRQAETILNAVLDAGINFIDTANCYGRSEEFIGRFISHRRDEFVLATKCGCLVKHKDATTDETPHVFTRENLYRGISESLERLKTDCIDIVQLHNPDIETCKRQRVVHWLQEMQGRGMVRHVSISTRFPELPTCLEWDVFDMFQVPYSAMERAHELAITATAQAGVGTIIRGGVGKGEPGEGLGSAETWAAFAHAALDELRDEGDSRTAFMLRFTLSHPHVNTVIVGTLSADHLAENVAAAERGPLAPDVYAEAKRRLDAAGQSPEEMP
ncbi:MAG: aldo/keto reductase [Phycisphaerae bacterium]|nr:aldo/keto reductase [Phycisphaerae bacterium]